MRNADVARIFEEITELLELQGANPFRIRAYRNAALTIGDLTTSLATIVAEDPAKLQELPGIGKDLAGKIATILETGTHPQLEELRSQFPPGVVEMLRIPGLGPKKVAILYRELGITGIAELKTACEQQQIQGLKGFGKKTEQGILEAIERTNATEHRALLAEVLPTVEEIAERLRHEPGVERVEIAGSARRCKETVGDLDLLAVSSDSAKVMDSLAADPSVEQVLQRGETKQRVRLRGGMELDLRVIEKESFGAAWQYFTGSKEHNVTLRRMAQQAGLKINEYGVYRGDKLVAGKSEEDVYKTLGLPWIPPELRENRREFEWAAAESLPKLLEFKEIRGDLHMHTTDTDGKNSLREMIEGARVRGLEYIAITDHSKRVSMANGLTADRLRKQWDQIRKLRREYDDIHILCGVECDILEDGELDLPEKVLAEGEWILAVLHYGLNQNEEQITKRLLNAISSPAICAIGHPTARLVGRRPPVAVDINRVLDAAASAKKILEINADPHRLDLDDILAAAAREKGIKIVIDTDAHSTFGFDNMQYGVYQARRAGLTKADVINTLPFSKFKKYLLNGDDIP